MLISVKHVSCHVLLILYFYCLKKIEIKQTIIYWLCTASLKPCRVQKRMKISKKKMNVPSTKNKVVGLPIQNCAWCEKAADLSQPNGSTAPRHIASLQCCPPVCRGVRAPSYVDKESQGPHLDLGPFSSSGPSCFYPWVSSSSSVTFSEGVKWNSTTNITPLTLVTFSSRVVIVYINYTLQCLKTWSAQNDTPGKL